ncbi:MAG: helix-turn-helix transcriptional regulator [Dehalococcoidia bacterium]|nr:helix-turn-helix transcriptional regulator [Dehalococcoidia bacterium]
MDTKHGAFEHAASCEHLLTERQREVLRLIARGCTNGEIGEQLGITLDGAKWNVSEILTKLGLASREEATAFWRWYQRPAARLSRTVRGLAPVSVAKWTAAVGVAVAAVAGMVFFLWPSASPTEPEALGPDTPFVLEATVQVESDGEVQDSSLSMTLLDRTRWRLSVVTDSGSMLQVADGKNMWSYSPEDRTYFQQELPPPSPVWPTVFVGLGIVIGPLQIADLSEVPALLERLAERDGASGTVGENGTGVILDRACTRFTYSPIWHQQTGAAGAGSAPAVVESYGGHATICVDPVTLISLSYTADEERPDGQVIRAELTSLEFRRMPDSTFQFEPPPGATNGSASAGRNVDFATATAVVPSP